MLTETWADAVGAQHNRPRARVAKTRTETLDTVPPLFALSRNTGDKILAHAVGFSLWPPLYNWSDGAAGLLDLENYIREG